jgi:hypothetical protein
LPYADFLVELLSLRFAPRIVEDESSYTLFLSATQEQLLKNGVLPDLEGVLLAEELQLPVFWRIASAPAGKTAEALRMLERLLARFQHIELVAPSGDVVLGYPDVAPLSRVILAERRDTAQIEFSRQLGAQALNALVAPHLIPLHSVTQEELLARNITRAALHERMLRAVVERSVRLVVMRPSVSGFALDPVAEFGGEIENLSRDIQMRGFSMRWPRSVVTQASSGARRALGAFACSAVFLLLSLRLAKRMRVPLRSGLVGVSRSGWAYGAGFALSLLLAVICWKIAFAARLLGALTSVVIVTEASLFALDRWRRPCFAALEGALLVTVGGMAIAAFFSSTNYLLRLQTFSGVKLTLLLPPLLVLVHDLHLRIHPESLREILMRPPLWGELLLGVILMGGAILILFRSDNVQFVPGFEVRLRDFLERVLIARPRSKEIFLGFPCLMLYAFVTRARLMPHYRELFRVGVVFGFSSMTNSFCHFHTPFFFTVIRQYNGLWVGILVGFGAVVALKYMGMPLLGKMRRIVFE